MRKPHIPERFQGRYLYDAPKHRLGEQVIQKRGDSGKYHNSRRI
ncbi:hypothetical protein CHCC20375_0682 [Bacillus licheniformis]|nr:hypothetical protein CHCC20375_0682 [Bacillus licheniformis]